MDGYKAVLTRLGLLKMLGILAGLEVRVVSRLARWGVRLSRFGNRLELRTQNSEFPVFLADMRKVRRQPAPTTGDL